MKLDMEGYACHITKDMEKMAPDTLFGKVKTVKSEVASQLLDVGGCSADGLHRSFQNNGFELVTPSSWPETGISDVVVAKELRGV